MAAGGYPVQAAGGTVVCLRRHPLIRKVVHGNLGAAFGLGGFSKHCARCGVTLRVGRLRHSCKVCNYHCCDGCYHWVLQQAAATAPPALPPPPPPAGAATDQVRRLSAGMPKAPAPATPAMALLPAAGALGLPMPRPLDPLAPFAPLAPPPPDMGDRSRTSSDPVGRSRATTDAVDRPRRLRACRYGTKCYRRTAQHLAEFAHPGDRKYKKGFVLFADGQKPEFETFWQLFRYHDPDESGHLTRDEFDDGVATMLEMLEDPPDLDLDKAWTNIGGNVHGHCNFRKFVTWSTKILGLSLPIGLEDLGSERPCRFRSHDGNSCSCPAFEPSEENEALCKCCGHKTSMHRSDMANQTIGGFQVQNPCWVEGADGLVQISNEETLYKLQELLTSSHKTTDNWTRDRGCKLHGVNGCAASCAAVKANRVPVPSGYTLVAAFRNQNSDLWSKYCLLKASIRDECLAPGDVPYAPIPLLSCASLELPLDDQCNEWYGFHGSSVQKLRSICESSFRLSMAGSGATWKDKDKGKGTPLYGYGVYFAERVTKADEYAAELPAGDEHEGCFAMLLCRLVGGRSNVVTTNEIEVDKLRADVFDGPYHSVYGDRVSTLGKPYREVVVYDKDQCYPEYMLVYQREYS